MPRVGHPFRFDRASRTSYPRRLGRLGQREREVTRLPGEW